MKEPSVTTASYNDTVVRQFSLAAVLWGVVGMLVGVFLLGYGLARFIVEFFREPDAQLVGFTARTGLHMGQWLTVPMIAAGIYLIVAAWRAGSRNQQGKSVKSEPAIMPKSSCSE